MLIQSAEELRSLTSNYYANNDFSKVVTEIELATEELAAVVGQEVIDLAERQQQMADVERDALLVRKVQRPIALLATLNLYRKNDLSHEDDGRKFKVSTDGTDKLPWEWQLERDDAIHMEEYYRAVDILVRYLNERRPEAWVQGTTYRLMQTLLIRSGAQMEQYFPIGRSERLYLLLIPFIREAQAGTVAPAYGSGWADLLAEDSIPESEAHYAACMAVALLAMGTAIHRLPLQLIPQGVVRGYMNQNGMKASEAATVEEVQRVADWMAGDASHWIDRMKRARDGELHEAPLLPENEKKNKFCIL